MTGEAESKKPKIVPKSSKATSKIKKMPWEKIAYYLEEDEDENSHLYGLQVGRDSARARLTFLDETNGRIHISYDPTTGDLNFQSDKSSELALRKMIQLLAKSCKTVTLTAADNIAWGIMEDECKKQGLDIDLQNSKILPQPKKHKSHHHEGLNPLDEKNLGNQYLTRMRTHQTASATSPFKKPSS